MQIGVLFKSSEKRPKYDTNMVIIILFKREGCQPATVLLMPLNLKVVIIILYTHNMESSVITIYKFQV